MTTTSTTDTELHGPVDYLLLEFPADRLTGEAAPALLDLVDRGLIRLFDVVVIHKAEDGSVDTIEISDPAAAGFEIFVGARSGMIDDADVREAAAAMTAGTVAALIIYENSWAAPFVAAVRNSGGEVVASARIPAADVIAALDALEQND